VTKSKYIFLSILFQLWNKSKEDDVKKILFLFLVMLIIAVNAFAAVPHLINYQGKLTDTSGNPLTGTYSITFKIYDAETAGNLLWEEAQAGVVIQKGIFSVLLGSVTNLGLAFDKPYFLEIKVGNEVMTPRQRITSAGYAFKAEQADQATNATTVANVGVSATPSANKLLPLDGNAKLPIAALKVYDSGWFSASIGSDTMKNHGLGTTKLLMFLYGATNISGANASQVQGNFLDYPPGNVIRAAMVRIIDSNNVGVKIAPYAPPYVWNGSSWVDPSCYRVIILALE
jgi:hypothetical protein